MFGDVALAPAGFVSKGQGCGGNEVFGDDCALALPIGAAAVANGINSFTKLATVRASNLGFWFNHSSNGFSSGCSLTSCCCIAVVGKGGKAVV